jgi:hypothetical protein
MRLCAFVEVVGEFGGLEVWQIVDDELQLARAKVVLGDQEEMVLQLQMSDARDPLRPHDTKEILERRRILGDELVF